MRAAPPRNWPTVSWLLRVLVSVALILVSADLHLCQEAIAQQRQRTPRIRRKMALQLVRRGLRLMQDQRYADAIGAFKQAQRLYPSERALFLLGQAYDLAGEPTKAAETYRQIPARAQGRLADKLRRRGLERMANADYLAAIADFRLAARLSSSLQLQLLLGQACELAGQLGEALKIFRSARERMRRPDRQAMDARIAALEKRQRLKQPTDSSSNPPEQPPEMPSPTDIEAPRVNLGDRRDDDIFGSDETDTPTPTKADAVDQRLLDLGTDKLQIGGLLYMRFNFWLTDGDEITDNPFSMPNFADIYFDARPSDRLRAFLVLRLSYNPSINESDPATGAAPKEKFRIGLSEYWLKFNIKRRVFFTVGKQLIRWGATKIWNPVDVINTAKRPIFSPIDDRAGLMMIKLHVPVEVRGWNFYAVGIFDDVKTLDGVGGAARAELVFSTAELGLTAAYRKSLDPKLGLDINAGVWNFDLFAEAAARFSERFESGVAMQVSGGLQYTFRVFQNDQLILGAEYFYNQEGSSDPDPIDLYSGAGELYYLGRHYGALTVNLPAPGRLDDWTFTASGIANFSDRSVAAQLQISVKALTFLTVRAILTAHMGKPGELRLGDLAFSEDSIGPARDLYNPEEAKDRPIPTQIIDFGVWLSLNI